MRGGDEAKTESKNRIEAILFMSAKALGISEIASATGIASTGYIKELVDDLINDYKSRGGALELTQLGSKYMLNIKEHYADMFKGMATKPDVSKGALRILAYISKNEPIIQSGIVKSFGSSTYLHIKELLEKDFIDAVRVGRTKRIKTTQKFREYFNLH